MRFINGLESVVAALETYPSIKFSWERALSCVEPEWSLTDEPEAESVRRT